MGRNSNIMKKAAALALTAAMLAQGTAFAAEPAEELEDILERQEELSQDSLLAQQLGLDELDDAMEMNGWQFSVKSGLTDGTLETLDMEGAVPADGYAGISFQVDPKLKKWLFQANTGAEEPFVDFELYGDMHQLALSIPQLYSGAVGLLAGNLREQYQSSELSRILDGSISSEDAPDIDMQFYPDDDVAEWASNPFSQLQEQIEEKAEQIAETLQVEKTESDGDTVYAAHVQTADIMEIYSMVLNGYVDLLMDPALSSVVVMSGDVQELRDSVDQVLDVMEAVLGDELVMNFHVQDGLVASIDYDLYIDSAAIEEAAKLNAEKTEIQSQATADYDVDVDDEDADGIQIEDADGLEIADTNEIQIEDIDGLEIEDTDGIQIEDTDGLEIEGADEISEDGFDVELMTEVFEGTVNEAGEVTDREQAAESFPGYFHYEVVFVDPANPDAGMDFHMTVTDGTSELAKMAIIMRNTRTETKSETTVDLEMTGEGETVYSGTIYTGSFDTETGDLNMSFGITDPESGEKVSFDLDGTFTQIDPGRGFTFVADNLGITADGESIGLTSELSVSADPGVIDAPAEVLQLFQADQEALVNLVNEIAMNAQSLMDSMMGSGSEQVDSAYDGGVEEIPAETELSDGAAL